MLENLWIVVIVALCSASALALFPSWRKAAGRAGVALLYGSLLLAIVVFSMLKAAVILPIRRLTA